MSSTCEVPAGGNPSPPGIDPCCDDAWLFQNGSCLHIIHLHSDTVTVGHESEMGISDRFLYSSTCICVMVINGELSTLGFPQHVYT